jgi:HEAT repeat protein
LRTLDELKPSPDLAVREIARVLPDVKDPRQRAELAEALRHFPMKESAARLCELLDDPDEQVRQQAIASLRLMARRVDRSGGQRVQRGGEFAPQVEGLVPQLIKAAGDKAPRNRVVALFALADTLDPAAIAEIRRRLKDESAEVRFHAACFLTEYQDASGLSELKQMLTRLRSETESKVTDSFDTERLLACFERITGKSFGPVPMNPGLSSDSRQAQELEQRSKQLLETWAAWWAWEPAAK